MKKILSATISIIIAIFSLTTVSAYDSSSNKFGDANGDGTVSILDATIIQKHISELEYIADDRLFYSDTDGDKLVNIVDATLIQKKLANIISEFPAETNLPSDTEDYTPIDNISGDVVTADMLGQIEKYFYELVNEERTSKGLKPLTYNKHLDDASQLRSLELTEFYSHTRPDGTSCFTAIDSNKYRYLTLGENISYFYHISGTVSYNELVFTGSDKQLKRAAEIVFNAFKSSPGHYANMMSVEFENAGIGISYIWYEDLNIPQFYLAHMFGTAW